MNINLVTVIVVAIIALGASSCAVFRHGTSICFTVELATIAAAAYAGRKALRGAMLGHRTSEALALTPTCKKKIIAPRDEEDKEPKPSYAVQKLPRPFTEEEEAEFTRFNMLAFYDLLKEAKTTGEHVLCWLCMSETERERVRVRVLTKWSEKWQVKLDKETVLCHILSLYPQWIDQICLQLRDAELQKKRLREDKTKDSRKRCLHIWFTDVASSFVRHDREKSAVDGAADEGSVVADEGNEKVQSADSPMEVCKQSMVLAPAM